MSPVHPDILAALTAGIQAEVAAYVFYKEASKHFNQKDIKEVLERLAGDEKNHFNFLERQYDSLVRSEKWISTADIMKQKGLPEIGEDMTARHRETIDRVKKAKGKRQILDIALEFENEARDLYTAASMQSESKEAKQTFDALAKFEEGHVRIISELIDQLDD